MKLISLLENKVRGLRRDEGGSVLLLSAMMGFLLAIMALFAMDASQAVYSRVVAQNAADGAAESAALWQARGLNLEQMLNNFHYQFNAAIFAIETAELAACGGVLGGLDAEADCCADIFCPCCCLPSAIQATRGLCQVCKQAGPTNDTQKKVADSILGIQSGIATLFPGLEFVYANQVADTAGGNSLVQVVPSYLQSVASGISQVVGLSLPSIPSSGASSGFALASVLPGIYAFPLSPSSLSLNVQKVEGTHWPWNWRVIDFISTDYPERAAAAFVFNVVARPPCLVHGVSFDFDHLTPDDWGWKDSYYRGHPGSMTWIAGTTNRSELAGLGLIRWMNGGDKPADIKYELLDQENLRMYTGSATNSSAPLMIPPFIAFASSQVEGTGVIGKDTGDFFETLQVWDQPPVDSTPRVINVYMSGSTAGTDYFINH